MKKLFDFQMISNMKIMAKTIIPLTALIVLTMINGMSGVNNPKKIMDASEEINNVHFVNVYNLQMLNYNFEQFQRIVFAHCVSDTEEAKRDLEAQISEVYASNSEVMEILNGTITEGENLEIYSEFQNDYAEFMNDFTKAIEYSAFGDKEAAAAMANGAIRDASDKISADINVMILNSQKAMVEKVGEQDKTYAIARGNAIGAGVMALMTSVVVFLIIVLQS